PRRPGRVRADDAPGGGRGRTVVQFRAGRADPGNSGVSWGRAHASLPGSDGRGWPRRGTTGSACQRQRGGARAYGGYGPPDRRGGRRTAVTPTDRSRRAGETAGEAERKGGWRVPRGEPRSRPTRRAHQICVRRSPSKTFRAPLADTPPSPGLG